MEDLKELENLRYKAAQKISTVRQIVEKLVEFYDMDSLKAALEDLVQAENDASVDLEGLYRKDK